MSITTQDALNERILSHLPKQHDKAELATFYDLIRDYPERGGKHLRGQLVLRSVSAHGVAWRRGLDVAAALELFQNWVLIHDDIEDDSEDRRGAPALHRTVGMPVALNVGDALHVYMWRVLHHLEGFSSDVQRLIFSEFEWMISRTAEGQHLDLSWVAEGIFGISEADYLEMVTLKTAYYTVVCPLRLGALCAEVEPDVRFTEAGIDLGVAFQIRDDILNLMPDISYGKEFAGDLFEAKRTLVLAHLFAHANGDEQEEVRERLAKPRNDKTEEDIGRVLGFIERYGSLAYAQEVAEARAARGLSLLSESFADLPNQDEAQRILDLLSSLASRKT